MTADQMANAIDLRSRAHHRRGRRGVKKQVWRAPLTQPELDDDKARWLDGQVRGWTAGRTL